MHVAGYYDNTIVAVNLAGWLLMAWCLQGAKSEWWHISSSARNWLANEPSWQRTSDRYRLDIDPTLSHRIDILSMSIDPLVSATRYVVRVLWTSGERRVCVTHYTNECNVFDGTTVRETGEANTTCIQRPDTSAFLPHLRETSRMYVLTGKQLSTI